MRDKHVFYHDTSAKKQKQKLKLKKKETKTDRQILEYNGTIQTNQMININPLFP